MAATCQQGKDEIARLVEHFRTQRESFLLSIINSRLAQLYFSKKMITNPTAYPTG